MPYQPVPDTLKVEMNFLQNGTPIVNVFHVQVADPADPVTQQATSGAFIAWWETLVRDGTHQSLVLQNVTVTDLSVANGTQYVDTDITDAAGALTTEPAAANAACVISWRTAYTGRSFRGRTYLGGLANESLASAQTLTTLQTTGVADWAEALLDIVEAIGGVLVVVSRYAAGVQRVTALATEIISIIVDNKVDSQRRRTAN